MAGHRDAVNRGEAHGAPDRGVPRLMERVKGIEPSS